METHSFVWVRTLAEFKEIASSSGMKIPVIRPDHHRFLRWSRVLDERVPRTCSAPDDLSHIVIALADEIVEFANFFAVRSGRTVVRIDPDAALQLIKDQESGSALVIGQACQFELGFIDGIAVSRIQVGLITGQDDAALSFAIAKALTEPRIQLPALYQDYLEDEYNGQLLDGSHGTLHASNQMEFGVLLLAAHGGPGHMKAGTVILCGPSEMLSANLRLSSPGCTTTQGRRKCRRQNSGHATIAFGDLGAHWLVLMSCAVVTLNAGIYTSDISLWLSICNGWPSVCIATRHQVPITQIEIDLFRSLINSRKTAGEIVMLLNKLEMDNNGLAPYVLFGDPLTINSAKFMPVPNQAAPEIQLRSSTLRRYANAIHGWAPTLKWLQSVGYEGALEIEKMHASIDQLLNLLSTRSHLQQHRLDDTLHRLLDSHIYLSDQLLINAFLVGTNLRNMVPQLVSTSEKRRHRALTINCEHCGSCLSETIWNRLLGGPDIYITNCPICGERDIRTESAPELIVQAPTTVECGKNFSIQIRMSTNVDATIGIELVDKKRASVAISYAKAWNGQVITESLLAPDTRDLHELRVFVVFEMSFALHSRYLATV